MNKFVFLMILVLFILSVFIILIKNLTDLDLEFTLFLFGLSFFTSYGFASFFSDIASDKFNKK